MPHRGSIITTTLVLFLSLVQLSASEDSAVSYCEASTWRGVTFPRTRACESVLIDCPDPENIEGLVRRKCECGEEKVGEQIRRFVRWEEIPDSNNCTHRWVRQIKAAIRNREVEDVSHETAGLLRTTVSRQAYGGDISGSVEIAQELLVEARSQFDILDDRNIRQKRAQNFTKSLGDCGDSLLSRNVNEVWQYMASDARVQKASDLMSSLERSAMLLADYSFDPRQSLGYNNWAMEVEVHRTLAPAPATFTAQAAPAADINFGDDGIAPGGGFGGPLGAAGFAAGAMNRASFANAAAAPPTAAEVHSDPVSFSSISKSPIIRLPSTSILSSSSAVPSSFGAPSGSFSPSATFASDNSPLFSPASSAGARQQSFEASSTSVPSSLRLGYFVFSSLGSILSNVTSVVNSQVIGATVNDATISVQLPETEPVSLVFFHLYNTGVRNARCVFWDVARAMWSTDGCLLISTNQTTSICQCSHLTSFAVLMDISGKLGNSEMAALDVVTVVGCAISIVCLALSFLVFTCFRSLRGLRSTIHANLCMTLLLGELVFVLGINRTRNEVACGVTALLLHLLFLSAFCWMLLEGVQLYMMLVQVFEPSSTHVIIFYAFAYGAPAIVVGISAGINWENYGTENYCWIDTTTSTIWAFAAPVAVVVAINIIFLLIALRVVLSVSSRDRTRSDRLRGWLKGSATLLCLLGITWIFGFLTAVHGASEVFAWIFTVLNCTQGVFIFVLHVLLNEKARSAVLRWLHGGGVVCCGSQDSTANFNSKEYLTSRQRFMNMVRGADSSTAVGDESRGRKRNKRKEDSTTSGPSTASTDMTKDKGPLTPTSKTSAWLSQIPSQDASDGTVDVDDDVTRIEIPMVDHLEIPSSENNFSSSNGSCVPAPLVDDDYVPPLARSTRTLDLSFNSNGSDKRAPVRRKKFPLGATDDERGAMGVSALNEDDIYRF